MFNQEQKNRFLERQMASSDSSQTEKYHDMLVNYFNRLEPFEDDKNKDFAQMNKEEIYEILGKFLTGGKTYQKLTLSILTEYLRWAIENNLSFLRENVLVGFDIYGIDLTDTYANTFLKDENDLIFQLDIVLSPINMDTIDNMYRCYLHLLFAGITPNEAIMLKEENIDCVNKKIKIEDRTIVISDYLLNLIKYILDMQEFTAIGVSKSGKEFQRKMPIVRTGFLLENSVSNSEKAQKSYRMKMKNIWGVTLSNKMAKCTKDINQTNILMSGIYFRIFENEKVTGEINCNEYFDMKRNSITASSNPNLIISNCKYEYGIWKKAFHGL